jgi:hypothetical protein
MGKMMHLKDIAEEGFKWVKEIASSGLGSGLKDLILKGASVFSRTQLVSRDLDDEAVFVQTIAALRRDEALRIHAWMDRLSSYQREDVIRSNAEATFFKDKELSEELRKERFKNAVEVMRRLAGAPTDELRGKIAITLAYIKASDEEYSAFRLARQLEELDRDLVAWIARQDQKNRELRDELDIRRAERARRSASPPPSSPRPGIRSAFSDWDSFMAFLADWRRTFKILP